MHDHASGGCGLRRGRTCAVCTRPRSLRRAHGDERRLVVPLSVFVREHEQRERAGHARPREWRVRPAAGFVSVPGLDSWPSFDVRYGGDRLPLLSDCVRGHGLGEAGRARTTTRVVGAACEGAVCVRLAHGPAAFAELTGMSGVWRFLSLSLCASTSRGRRQGAHNHASGGCGLQRASCPCQDSARGLSSTCATAAIGLRLSLIACVGTGWVRRAGHARPREWWVRPAKGLCACFTNTAPQPSPSSLG